MFKILRYVLGRVHVAYKNLLLLLMEFLFVSKSEEIYFSRMNGQFDQSRSCFFLHVYFLAA